VLYPNYVFINRGNHETEHMNSRYRFEEQVVDTYDYSMFMKIQSVFNLLPLCAVISDQVFVVHGGLSKCSKLTISEIKKCVTISVTFTLTNVFQGSITLEHFQDTKKSQMERAS
jgi:hypothetical protein